MEAYDSDGNAIEGLPDEAELKTLQEQAAAKEEADKKVADLDKKIKEYESDPAYKNLGILRKKAEEAEKERDEWKKKLAEAIPKDEPKQFSEEELDKRMDERAERKFQEKIIERQLNTYGDKKEVVKKVFEKLSSGEQLTEDKITELMETAAKAAGLNPELSGAITFHGGGTPKFDTEEKSHADTPEGQARASAMGLRVNPPKQ